MTDRPSTYILAIDPSSTCTGYACLSHRGDILEHGALKPNRRRDTTDVRITTMAAELNTLMVEQRPEIVVIEMPGGGVFKYQRGGGAGLSVYGWAAGYLLATIRRHGSRVELVDPSTWTRGKRKSTRTATVAMTVGSYDRDTDKGQDAADAIGLGRWWFDEQRFNGRKGE